MPTYTDTIRHRSIRKYLNWLFVEAISISHPHAYNNPLLIICRYSVVLQIFENLLHRCNSRNPAAMRVSGHLLHVTDVTKNKYTIWGRGSSACSKWGEGWLFQLPIPRKSPVFADINSTLMNHLDHQPIMAK